MKRPVPDSSLDESTEKSSGAAKEDSFSSGETLMRSDAGSGEHLSPLAADRYVIDDRDQSALLGRGGQGTVWRAYDKVLRRDVALKKMHASAQLDPGLVGMFVREARLTALLEHPGIVPLHDLGRDVDGTLYLALRRIEGKSLADTLAGAKGLDGRLALVPALVRACQAVAFAHERGVVHRDLKPQNIMLGRFGETYVLDWGLALVEDRREGSPDVTAPHQSTGVVGTPAYMSPEQALGLAADARSDVWGLGACLYHLLAGSPPIMGRSLQSAMGHASAGEVSPVLLVEPNAPRDLAAICEKALSVERSRRYANASELAADLESWLAGRTVSARSYSMGQLFWRALRANRRTLALVIVAALAVGSVVIFDEWRIRTERNEARQFVSHLIRELPRELDSSHSNVEVINTLTVRSQQWLSRTDLSIDELKEANEVLLRLASINADISNWAAARELYERVLELSLRGQALEPGNALFVAQQLEAKTGLGYCESQIGDPKRATELFEEAFAILHSWRGELTVDLRLAHGELGTKWGNFTWGVDVERSRKLFIEAAEAVLPLIDSDEAWVRYNSSERGANAVTALWSQGRKAEALAMAKRFYEAAARDCGETSRMGMRACLHPLTSYAGVLGWMDDPRHPQLLEEALKIEDRVQSRDADSVSVMYDSTLFFLEHGLFEKALERTRKLRQTGSADWGKELGPLAAVLAGDLQEVDAWRPIAKSSTTAGQLAFGLREAARGDYAAAAKHVRATCRRIASGTTSPGRHTRSRRSSCQRPRSLPSSASCSASRRRTARPT